VPERRSRRNRARGSLTRPAAHLVRRRLGACRA
jgi:hypothetical protein